MEQSLTWTEKLVVWSA